MPNILPRVLTALFLLPLILGAIFYLPPQGFALFSGVLVLLAAWEWARCTGLVTLWSRLLYVGAVCLVLLLLMPFPFSVLPLGAVAWILALVVLRKYERKPWQNNLIAGLFGIILLPICWQAINVLCQASPHPYHLLILFLFIWGADTVAYFVGCRWGKHKLSPQVSPGKSIEGAAGALVACVVLAVCIAKIADYSALKSLEFVLLSLITVVFSIIGDLFESMLKRQQGLKDSGKILPGHGGILDRIDSLIAAAPIFALGMVTLGLI